jgi:hypothetical protein
VNNQLAARQQILDPVSVQCIGNITCTTNPDEPVMGVFEVSSIGIYSYFYSREISGSEVDMERINPIDLTKYSESDCQVKTPPEFWMY